MSSFVEAVQVIVPCTNSESSFNSFSLSSSSDPINPITSANSSKSASSSSEYPNSYDSLPTLDDIILNTSPTNQSHVHDDSFVNPKSTSHAEAVEKSFFKPSQETIIPDSKSVHLAASEADSDSRSQVAVTSKVIKPEVLPELACAIPSFASKSINDGKPFIEYTIRVDNSKLTWIVYRRYSQFEALHAAIVAHFSGQRDLQLPNLPSKMMIFPNDEKLEFRRAGLEDYLRHLIAVPDVLTSLPFLKFIGLLAEDSESETERRRIFLEQALQMLDAGDIILFRTDFTLSAIQRSLTLSDYDHTGIVVRSSTKKKILYLLESTGDGVHTYDLRRRLTAWSNSNAFIVARCLNIPRDPESGYTRKLIEFVEKVDGLDYGLHPMDIILRKSVSVDTRKSYFCSELVAAAYKAMDIIDSSRPANSFFPGTFSEGQDDKLGLLHGFKLGREIIIEFKHPEVIDAFASATRSDDVIETSSSSSS